MEGLRAPDVCVKLGQTDAHSFTLYFNSSFCLLFLKLCPIFSVRCLYGGESVAKSQLLVNFGV